MVSAGVNMLQHYRTYGHREGRSPHPLIDLKLIASQLAPDFDGDPVIAYLQSRGPELKPHTLFDPIFVDRQLRRLRPDDARPSLIAYLDSDPELINPSRRFRRARLQRPLYPDTIAVNPLAHYAGFGEAEGRPRLSIAARSAASRATSRPPRLWSPTS